MTLFSIDVTYENSSIFCTNCETTLLSTHTGENYTTTYPNGVQKFQDRENMWLKPGKTRLIDTRAWERSKANIPYFLLAKLC